MTFFRSGIFPGMNGSYNGLGYYHAYHGQTAVQRETFAVNGSRAVPYGTVVPAKREVGALDPKMTRNAERVGRAGAKNEIPGNHRFHRVV
jgi:hypothetical protein